MNTIGKLSLVAMLCVGLSACDALKSGAKVEALESRVSEVETQNETLKNEVDALRAQVKGLVAVTSQNALAIDEPSGKAALAMKAAGKGDVAKKTDTLDENIEITLDRFETCEAPCAEAFKNISRKTMRKLAANPGASASIRACAGRCPMDP